jgi:hypothetical protein
MAIATPARPLPPCLPCSRARSLRPHGCFPIATSLVTRALVAWPWANQPRNSMAMSVFLAQAKHRLWGKPDHISCARWSWENYYFQLHPTFFSRTCFGSYFIKRGKTETDYKTEARPICRNPTRNRSRWGAELLDIWAWGTRTARIVDHVRLSGQKPWRWRPMKVWRVDQRED